MRALMTVAVLVSSTFPAVADQGHIPDRYRSGPFLAPVSVFPLSPAEVHAFCGDYAIYDAKITKGRAAGCALFGKGSSMGWDLRFDADACNVFVIGPEWPGHYYAWFTYGYVVEHEKAHCRGWAPDHPD